jgi:hypothetical protein
MEKWIEREGGYVGSVEKKPKWLRRSKEIWVVGMGRREHDVQAVPISTWRQKHVESTARPRDYCDLSVWNPRAQD